MKYIKLYENFLLEKSTEDMTADEIKKTKEDLNNKGKYKSYVGNKQQIDRLIKNLSSTTGQWVYRINDSQIKVFDTPDDNSKQEIGDLVKWCGLHQIDLNNMNEETDQEWLIKNCPKEYDSIVRKWCDWSSIDWKKIAKDAGKK